MVQAAKTSLNQEQRRQLLRAMLESRHGDLREESLNRQGKGHFHVSGRGHEALSAIGVQLRGQDFIAPYYRDRGLCLARGLTTRELALEYFAKRGSASRGRMMPSHFSSRALNIISVPTPTAAQLVPACGLAWGLQLDGKDGVVVTTVGDAATRQGDFYEAVNFALERRLPLLLVVEDNAYGISTPTRKINPLAIQSLNPAQWTAVDGTDVEAVHAAAEAAIARLRAGQGPVLLWMKLERLSSHTSSDDHTLYRSKADLAALAAGDPIVVLRERMVRAGELTAAEFDALEQEIKEQVRRDYAEAERAEDPRADELFAEVSSPGPDLAETLFPPGRYRMGDLINRTLRAGLDADPGRVIMGEDVEDPKGGVFRLTQKLSTDFPGQVFNAPLAESTIIGLAGGLALYGRRPVFEIQFIDFIFPGFNQLVSNLANLRWRSNGQWKVPAVFYAPYGAYLPGGGLWHSQANEAALAHFPGLNVVIPSTPEDAAGLLWTAMHADDITLMLAPKHMLWAEHETQAPVAAIPFGRARRRAEGDDVTLVAWGNTVEQALEAVAGLQGEAGVDLIDLRSIVPWDKAMIEESVRKTGRLIVVQEDGEACSVGQMIIQHIAGRPDLWARLVAPPVLVTKGNVMIGYNPIYEYAALPDVARITEAIWRTVSTTVVRDGSAVPPSPAPVASPPPAPKSAAPGQAEAPPADGTIVVRVPIMGEGLRTARVVSLLKQPGDAVQPDDVLCELETDKAVYPVEASFAGTFAAWQVAVDATVQIGQILATVRGEGAAALPPAVPKAGPAAPAVVSAPPSPPPAPPMSSSPTRPPALHPAITKRLDGVVSANMELDVRFAALRAAREQVKQRGVAGSPSPSLMMAWAVTRALEKHPAMRCLTGRDGTLAEQAVFALGVAVALPGDKLATAAIPQANRLAWPDFVATYNREIEATRQGKVVDVQAPMNLTSLGAFGIEKAWPIVVPPSVATIFIGTAHEKMINEGGVILPVQVVTLSLTFDHRAVNGAGVAAFLQDLKRELEGFALPG